MDKLKCLSIVIGGQSGASQTVQQWYGDAAEDMLDEIINTKLLDLCNLAPPGEEPSLDCIEGDLFAMRLYYDQVPSMLNAVPQKNGNISAIEWSVNGGEKMAYGYTYDAFDRLTEAQSAIAGQDGWEKGFFDATYTYDKEGNIGRLQRWGISGMRDGGRNPLNIDGSGDPNQYVDFRNPRQMERLRLNLGIRPSPIDYFPPYMFITGLFNTIDYNQND